MNDSLYENKNYFVRVNSSGDGYDVVNKETKVVEFTSTQFPECIFASENLNVVLVYKTYEWIQKNAEEKEKSPEAVTSDNVVPLIN